MPEPRAWLATIAHGLAVDQLRRRSLETAYAQVIASLLKAKLLICSDHQDYLLSSGLDDALFDNAKLLVNYNENGFYY